MNRRGFLYSSALLIAGCARAGSNSVAARQLTTDPERIMDLPAGFSYSIVCKSGAEMNDGLLMPARPDGMAAFDAGDERVALVRNHENLAGQNRYGAFGQQLERLNKVPAEMFYDYGEGKLPGTGGTTTLIYNPTTKTLEHAHLSLAGTELNCAGGPTPWGTWLSCEECFNEDTLKYSAHVPREKQHGYVFEVNPMAGKLEPAKPLPALGRFVHEAAAVDEVTGYVYLTEDRYDSLLYRCIPKVPGDLAQGGKLQALAFVDSAITDTANWDEPTLLKPNVWHNTRWIDFDVLDSGKDDLRIRGKAAGSARFVRGEGIWYQNDEICFTCTEGGAAKLGQVFRYKPGRGSLAADGEIMLLVEAETGSPMQNADNLTFTPWGGLVVCEDRPDHCGLFSVQLDGSYKPFALHTGSKSELAGVCFSPDAKTMFVNIQVPGLTLAITGPFKEYFSA